MGISERLKQIRDYFNLNQNDFAESLGLKQGSYSDIERGRRKGLSQAIIEGIAKSYNQINIDWLLTGEGEMLKKKYSIPNATIIENPSFIMVSVVSQYAAAGYLSGYADEEYIETLPKIPFFVDHDPKGKYMGFEVRGDSMDDDSTNSIIEGDTLICREIKPELWCDKLHIRKYFFVIAHKTEGILVKQITSHNPETGDITIHSLNSFYPDQILNLRDVAQLFNVIQISRKPRL